ncbi:MAG: nucleoside 2-deoxyribosyltransferase [Coxiellaceae bacterium]|nr:nucleoside 2-deoxyribosyltransferase [Coxiellaceae bacterium]
MRLLRVRWILALIFSLLFQCIFAQPANARPTQLYFAAPLFNASELQFNQNLVNALERRGYKVTLPQRDGFEGNVLAKEMKKYVAKSQVHPTLINMIYLLDIGRFIPRADAVVAILDEPVDDGVITEITYAHLMGKKVIGLRTDSRGLFGHHELLGGMHSFVAKQCDELLLVNKTTFKHLGQASIFNYLSAQIGQYVPNHQNRAVSLPPYVMMNPQLGSVIGAANKVFQQENNMRQANLGSIVKRMIKNKKLIAKALPLKRDFA